MTDSEPGMSDAELAELLTLTVEVDEYVTYYQNHLGQLHRTLGPAAIYWDGTKEWYQNGKPHRTGGPAYVSSFGFDEWWLDGDELTEEQWNERVKSL